MDNATFYYFKPSGKYYSQSRGYLPPEVFEPYLNICKVIEALQPNAPGLFTNGESLRIFIVPDNFGWPITLSHSGENV